MRESDRRSVVPLFTTLLIATWPAPAVPAAAQDASLRASATRPAVAAAVRHDTSPPLREMVRPLDEAIEPGEPKEVPLQLPIDALERAKRRNQPLREDPLRQFAPGKEAAPDPTVNFEAQSDDDNAATPGAGRLVPPDTEGDVGPNHYVQMINVITEIYDKNGNSVLGPFANFDIFSGFGGPCEANNDGDPVALYDQLADRWMLSQFSINEGIQCVAVSTTSDPTGSYHRYEFTVSPGANDYPKMGVWSDGYYLTFNEFTPAGDFIQAVACAFEREEMLGGNPAQQVCFGAPPNAGGDTFFSLQPSHLEGLTPPPPGTPNPFIMAFDDETWGGSPDGGQDFYKLWHFAVDWANPGGSTFTGPISVPTAEFDAEFCSFSRNCIPQPSTTSGLDVLGQFTMFRAVYRNFGAGHIDGAHDELWVNHTVDLDGTSHAGIRWTEIRNPAATPVLHQTGTHGPADNENRWMGSLSVDDSGNMLLAYSVSSETVFPSIRYAGRLVSDPLGTLGQEENELWAGTGSQTGSGNRWGDYSTVSLDESDGCSFWFTTEYYETTASFDFKTRVGATNYVTCVSAEVGTIAGTVTDLDSGAPISGATVTADDGAGGVFSTTTGADGTYAMLVPADTYDVTASATGYEPETETGVVVTADTTTTVDFTLDPGPVADISPASFSFEIPLGESAGDTLTIANPGTADLVWGLTEADSADGCAGPVDVPWLAASPTGGTTVPGGSDPVQVTVDTAALEIGTFEATLCVTTNDSDAPLVPVPVSLDVAPPATFGTVEGTVLSVSSCLADFSEPLAGATVTITGQLDTFVLTTDDQGFYQQLLDEAESPVNIDVTAAEHFPGQATGVVVTAGQVTVEDFDLILDAPCADTTPDAMSSTLLQGESEVQDLTIANLGSQTLDWTIQLDAGVTVLNAPMKGTRHAMGARAPDVNESRPQGSAANSSPVDVPSEEDEAAGIDSSPPAAEAIAPSITGAARNQLVQDGVLLLANTTADVIVALDPETGDVLDPAFISTPEISGAAQQVLLHPDGERILVSAQSQDVVHAYDVETGAYLGVFAPIGGADSTIMDNIRGMVFHPDTGNLLVASASGDNSDSVVEFDADGNFLGTFIDSGAGGITNPWFLIFRDADALLSDGTGDGIYAFAHDGTFLELWEDDAGNLTNFPEQITEIANGNILAAVFSSPSGAHEFDSEGARLAIYDPVTGLRGVFELGSGNILVSNSSGVHEISRDNVLVETKITGNSYMVSFVKSLNCDIPDWLSVNPTSGSTAPGGSDDLTVSFNATGLAVGEHTAGICVESNDPLQPLVQVPVTLTVQADGPVADITPTSFAFEIGEGETETQVLNVGNLLGTEDLTWDVGEADGAGDCASPVDVPWLSATPAAGTTPAGDSVPVDVTVDSAALFEGDYTAQLCVTTNDPVAPMVPIPVTLTVIDTRINCGPGETPEAFYFSDLEGDNGGWTGGGSAPWEWGAPELGVFEGCDNTPEDEPDGAFSGLNVWATNLNGCYPNSGDESFLSQTFDFSMLTGPIELSWWNWYEVNVSFDQARVHVNGDELFSVDTTAPTPDYIPQKVDLSAYAGNPAVTIDFVLQASTVVNRSGWYVDDIKIERCIVPNVDISPESFDFEVLVGGTDAEAMTIGNIGTATLEWSINEADGDCTVPVDVPWLTATPVSGTAPPDGSSAVDVMVDTATLVRGSYAARLCVTTNDPDAPLVPVPVSLTVFEITLDADGRRVQGEHVVDLSWNGARTPEVDIYRDGELIVTTANDGFHTDFTGGRGRATYTYQLCEAGTETCSEEVAVSFGGPPR